MARSRAFYERALQPFGVRVVQSSQGEGRHYSCHCSCGGSVVLVDEAAKAVATADLALRRSLPSLIEFGRPEVEGAMRPFAVVVVDVDAEHAFEVAAVEDQHVGVRKLVRGSLARLARFGVLLPWSREGCLLWSFVYLVVRNLFRAGVAAGAAASLEGVGVSSSATSLRSSADSRRGRS